MDVDQVAAFEHECRMTWQDCWDIWRSRLLVGAFAMLTVSCDGKLQVWEQIRVVGSTSAIAYGEAVAEELLLTQPKLKHPIIEPTGTGTGIKIFCGGKGGSTPDITFASRPMKKEEAERCKANDVGTVIEIPLGLDGLVLVQVQQGTLQGLLRIELYEALARMPFGRTNQSFRWSAVGRDLPDDPIIVYGPASSSGTYGGVSELFFKPACNFDLRLVRAEDDSAREKICTAYRDDGPYVTVEEGSGQFLRKITTNPQAVGVTTFGFANKHKGQLRPLTIDGVAPSEATIRDGSYSGSRMLYAYIKKEHLAVVPGLPAYVKLLAELSGPDGQVPQVGLIPATDAERAKASDIVRANLSENSGSRK
jgi:phosphate transport system substrate-binding protein